MPLLDWIKLKKESLIQDISMGYSKSEKQKEQDKNKRNIIYKDHGTIAKGVIYV